MDAQLLSFYPGLLYDRHFRHVHHLLGHVQFHQRVYPILYIPDQVISEFTPQFSKVAQPRFKGAVVVLAECCFHSPAPIMPSHDNVLDFQVFHCVLNDSQHIYIRRGSHIGDVPMHEHLPGLKADNLVRRNPRVRTTNPQIFWWLHSNEPFEKIGVFFDVASSPCSVIFHNFVKVGHVWLLTRAKTN